MSRRAGDSVPCAALHLLLVAPALLLEIDAHEPRRELREEPGGAHDADEIGDGKGDGNPVGHRRGSAAGRPSRAIASLAVPMVADSVSEPAMTPAAVPAS